MKCSLEILQTPIRRVLYLENYSDPQGTGLLRQANVEVIQFFMGTPEQELLSIS
jgi:deoxycytidylate deaminase